MRITKRLIAMRASHQLGNQQLMEEDKAVTKKIPVLRIKGNKALLKDTET